MTGRNRGERFDSCPEGQVGQSASVASSCAGVRGVRCVSRKWEMVGSSGSGSPFFASRGICPAAFNFLASRKMW